MATKWVTLIVMLLSTALEVRSVWPTIGLGGESLTRSLRVFESGSFKTNTSTIPAKERFLDLKRDVLIVSPTTPGVYPIILFVPSALVQNSEYTQLFDHIASHGYIVVAPQAWSVIISSQTDEIEMVASVANWIPDFLDSVLPANVKGDPNLLALSGHGRGGKTAFALALGMSKTNLKVQISGLIGVSPVEGPNKILRSKPYVLKFEPNSFDLSMPTMVIGTGLGNRSKIPFGPSCAPNDMNYDEYFNECKSGTMFVVTEYGHMDLLNDKLGPTGIVANAACVNGKGGRDVVRRTVGGLVVAYLDASFLDEPSDYVNVITNPSLAPTKVNPIKTKTRTMGGGVRYYSAV